MATASEAPLFVTITAMIAEVKPATEPTERSISPSSSTRTMPSAMMPVGAANWVSVTRLREERNAGSRA